ncbi:MAG: antibiotic biosynthesis monooxygenase [Kutzneria sp.]|nr:antibiotic biosynthesis monooxygenase [Kutzneria sp.]
MIIVAGHLRVAMADRDRFLARSHEAMRLARTAPGCHDFVVAADPLDAERVNVYERWTDRAVMHAFRGDGPDEELQSLIAGADIGEFEVVPAADR